MHQVGDLQGCVCLAEAPAFTTRPSDQYRAATATPAPGCPARCGRPHRSRPFPSASPPAPRPPQRPARPGAPPAHARCRRAVPPAGTRPRRCPGPRNVLRAAASRSAAAAVPFKTSKDLRAPAIHSGPLLPAAPLARRSARTGAPMQAPAARCSTEHRPRARSGRVAAGGAGTLFRQEGPA